MNDPRLAHALSVEDEKALSRMIDDEVYFDEHERIHEVPIISEGLDIGE